MGLHELACINPHGGWHPTFNDRTREKSVHVEKRKSVGGGAACGRDFRSRVCFSPGAFSRDRRPTETERATTQNDRRPFFGRRVLGERPLILPSCVLLGCRRQLARAEGSVAQDRVVPRGERRAPRGESKTERGGRSRARRKLAAAPTFRASREWKNQS